MTGLEAQTRLGLRQAEPGNGRDRGGGGEQRKTALLANPERQRERGMCLQRTAPGASPRQKARPSYL